MNRAAAIAADAVLVVYVYVGAVLLRHALGGPAEMLATILVAAVPFAVIHVAALYATEGYDFSRLRSESDIAFSACAGVLLGTALAFLLSTAFILYSMPKVQVVGRSVFLFAGLVQLAVLPGWRIWVLRLRRRRGELGTRVLLAGDAAGMADVMADLDGYEACGHRIVGAVLDEGESVEGLPVLGVPDALPEVLTEHNVGEVLLLGEHFARDPERLLRLFDACDAAGAAVHLLPGYYDALVGRLDLYAFGGLPMIGLKKAPLSSGYALVKRAMDATVAAAGLVLASPLLAAIAIAVRRDSPGPVLFLQERCGLDGRVFKIVKFRSMAEDAEAETGPVWAEKDDPRVTRVGRFLRDKRLDELPQLWNVLKGEMSLVGPRPERPYFVAKFREDLPLFPLRMRVRPGLTSLSHVWGRYDSTPGHRLLYDLTYMSNVSFMLDLRILVDTVKIVLTGRGAQ